MSVVKSLLQTSQSLSIFVCRMEIKRALLSSRLLSGLNVELLLVNRTVMSDCLALPGSGFSSLPSRAWVAAS